MTRLARLRRAILLCAVLIGLPGSLHAQEEAPASAPVVAGVDIVNNQFLQRETLLFYVSTKPGDRYDELKAVDGILNPDAIAEAYWQLHCQQRSAWTHEIDLRPWMEKW